MKPSPKFNPTPYAYHEEISVTIEKLTNLGHGLGRHDGWVVMVPFALPGEVVRARVWRNHSNYSQADLVEILKPSPDRVEPECALFGSCGGCQYQNYAYARQLEWKTQQVSELVERLGGLEFPINPCHPSPRQYGYRSKLTPHYQKPREDKPLDIGFLHTDVRKVIDVPQCPIGTAAINEALPIERQAVRDTVKKRKRGGTLLLRDALEGVITDNNAIVSQNVGNLVFQFQAGEFFQNNPFILPEMVDYVIAQARSDEARFLVDAYCGAGVFCLSAGRHFVETAGVEISPSSVAWANANATLNGVKNCSFLIGKAEAIFAKIDFPASETTVIIDPPRKGCDRLFLDQLFTYAPTRVVYVSCDPATQARDLKAFLEHGYQVEAIQPFDLFPQTRHIESVATLQKVVEV